MKVTPIKTKPIIEGDNLFSIINLAIPSLVDGTILAITSKIISICEGSIVQEETGKDKLIRDEADLLLNQKIFGKYLTIKDNILIPDSGIDESNGDNKYILWPRKPQETANQIRDYLVEKTKLKNIGVIITDSKTTPLRWGTTGVGISWSGFSALNNYIGEPDIFGKKMEVTKANILDGLAAASVLVMGEGSEQTPMAVIEEVPFVNFEDRNPTEAEVAELVISIDDDLYSPLLKAVEWKS